VDPRFGGVIWTNHALERLRERGIKQGDAWATFMRPDQSREGSNIHGSWVYYKTYGSERLEVVAKQNEKKEWVIMSVWSRPVYEDQKPHHKASRKDSFFIKVLKKLLGVK